MFKKTLWLSLALALGMVLTAQAKEWKTVRIGTEGAYPPWNATDANGNLVGAEIDLGRELCKRMQVECTFVAQDWDGIIPALQQGKYDAIIAGMSITPERQEVINFSQGYMTDGASFITAKGSDLDSSSFPEKINLDRMSANEKAAIDRLVEVLDGKTIGVQSATIHANFVEKYLTGSTMRTYQTQDDLNLDMASGRIDAALADTGAFEEFLESDSGQSLTFAGPRMSGDVFGAGVGIGLRKSDTDLLGLFNKAIDSVRADGTLSRISNQWFGKDISM